MDKDRVEGAAKQAKGTIKETVGKVTGDDALKEEGLMDQAEGKVKEGAADVKSTVDGLVKKVTGGS